MDRYILVVGLPDGLSAVVDTEPTSGNPIVVATGAPAAAMAAYRDQLNGE